MRHTSRGRTAISSTLLLCAGILGLASSALGGETRFEVDSSMDLAELARDGQPLVSTRREGDVFRTDASAVLSVDADRLFAVSKDFNDYVRMRMPHLRASVVLDEAGDILHTWNWMEIDIRVFGTRTKQVSRHCYEVRLQKTLPEQAMGNEWYLHPCPAQVPESVPAPLRRAYRDASAFSRMDGSWYIKRLPDGADGKPRVYVRYFLEYVFKSGIPNFIIEIVAKDELNRGIRDVILTLAREAGSQR